VAIHRYGRTIVVSFVPHYTEKLWSTAAERLLPSVAGQRLKGLTFKTFVVEALSGRRSKTAHLDGTFYYPRLGIGMLMERLADAAGRESIRTESRVTRLRHEDRRIVELEVGGGEWMPVESVVSTLPVTLLTNILDPAPPESVLAAARELRFQSVTLVVLLLNRPRVTSAASLYFPDPSVPFTRAYEPKNRSAVMSPPDRTSLAVEIPGQPPSLPMRDDAALTKVVTDVLSRLGIIRANEVTGSMVHRIPFAYPILEIGSDARLRVVNDYIAQFRNLHSVGRSGAFAYVHIHDLLRAGREAVERVITPQI